MVFSHNPAESVLFLLVIANDDALKIIFSVFIIMTSILSSFLDLVLGLHFT